MQLKKTLQKQIERIEKIEKTLQNLKGEQVVFELTSDPAKSLEAWLIDDDNFKNVSVEFKTQVNEIIHLLKENVGVSISDLRQSLEEFRGEINSEIHKCEVGSNTRTYRRGKSSNGRNRIVGRGGKRRA